MADKIHPLGNWVLIIPIVDEQRYGLLILPSSRTALIRGKVVAVGPGTRDAPIRVKVGDTVLFSPDSPAGGGKAAMPTKDGVAGLLVRDNEFLAVLELDAEDAVDPVPESSLVLS